MTKTKKLRLNFAIRIQMPEFKAMWIAARAKFGAQAESMVYVGSANDVAYFQLHGNPEQFTINHADFGA